MYPVGPSVAARLIEVRSVGHSGLDLLTLSSSHFDPKPKWPLSLFDPLKREATSQLLFGRNFQALEEVVREHEAPLCRMEWL